LETQSPTDSSGNFQVFASQASAAGGGTRDVMGTEDPLVELFRHKYQVPLETFMEQMREQRQAVETRSR
jgi:hypothetical protein